MSYIDHSTVSLSFAALTFDVSILEEYVPLTQGITVCMANENEIHNPLAMRDLLIENKVDTFTATPYLPWQHRGYSRNGGCAVPDSQL